jgi:hypothetical protein
MGCLVTVVGIFCPRICMVFILLITDWFSKAYDSFIWPFIGFFVMPYTTLTYMGAMVNNGHSVDGGWLILMIIAIVADFSTDTYEVQKRTNNGRNS